MAPGVSEYNAIVDGDWKAFAIAAGIDVVAVGVGAVTAGAGYGAVKGGEIATKSGAKILAKTATKEIAEAGAEKVLKETAQAGVEKVVKEAAEAGTERLIKETAQTGVEKAAKEITEKIVKLDEVEKKAFQILKNKYDGLVREETVQKMLVKEFGEDNVIREALLRNADGLPIKDIITGEARRIDFIVKNGDAVLKSIEVTSENAVKRLQAEKELRILNQAWEAGGVFIKDTATGKLIPFAEDIATQIWRFE